MEKRSRGAALFFLLPVVLVPAVSVNSPVKTPFPINPLLVEEQLLWVSGFQGEVDTYRIPVITFTPKGSLLAFAEARKWSSSDVGAKFIAVRRSTDKGLTWSPTMIITDDVQNADGLNLGSVVVDEEGLGSVILIYTMCFHEYHCSPPSTMLIKSTDDGISWSKPQNISAQLNIKSFIPGPGFGIQKRYNPHKGRLVVCGHGRIVGDGLFCLLSDDHGKNWNHSQILKSIPFKEEKRSNDFNPDECQPVEMMDGSILINVRNQNSFHCRCRVMVRSYDGGSSLLLEDMYFDYALVDPVVAAGALQKDGVLYFTNPSHDHLRVNLTLRWSLTNGNSWEQNAFQIWAGPSGYSSLTSLNTDSPEDMKYIFVIYEKGHKYTTETISFAKIHLYGGL